VDVIDVIAEIVWRVAAALCGAFLGAFLVIRFVGWHDTVEARTIAYAAGIGAAVFALCPRSAVTALFAALTSLGQRYR
jgi:hypothetical protein